MSAPIPARAAAMRAPVIVLGATGRVGRGVVQAAVDAGTPVVAVARDAGALRELQRSHPRAALDTLVASVAGDDGGAALAATLQRMDRPWAGVVAAICGGGDRDRLLDHPAAQLRRSLDEDLLPHLVAARHLLPLLSRGGRGGGYVLVGGPGSARPWAGRGQRSVSAAALQMMARVLHEEARAFCVRVQLLSVDTPVCDGREPDPGRPHWPSALAVGQRALAMAEQRDANRRAEAVVRFVAAVAAPPGSTHAATAAQLSAPAVSAAPAQATPNPLDAAAGPPAMAPGAPTPAACLHDARRLLRSLLPGGQLTASRPNQEPSP